MGTRDSVHTVDELLAAALSCLLQSDYYLRGTHTHLVVSLLSSSCRVPTSPGKSWKVLENEVGSGKSWKLKCGVLESPGIQL